MSDSPDEFNILPPGATSGGRLVSGGHSSGGLGAAGVHADPLLLGLGSPTTDAATGGATQPRRTALKRLSSVSAATSASTATATAAKPPDADLTTASAKPDSISATSESTASSLVLDSRSPSVTASSAPGSPFSPLQQASASGDIPPPPPPPPAPTKSTTATTSPSTTTTPPATSTVTTAQDADGGSDEEDTKADSLTAHFKHPLPPHLAPAQAVESGSVNTTSSQPQNESQRQNAAADEPAAEDPAAAALARIAAARARRAAAAATATATPPASALAASSSPPSSQPTTAGAAALPRTSSAPAAPIAPSDAPNDAAAAALARIAAARAARQQKQAQPAAAAVSIPTTPSVTAAASATAAVDAECAEIAQATAARSALPQSGGSVGAAVVKASPKVSFTHNLEHRDHLDHSGSGVLVSHSNSHSNSSSRTPASELASGAATPPDPINGTLAQNSSTHADSQSPAEGMFGSRGNGVGANAVAARTASNLSNASLHSEDSAERSGTPVGLRRQPVLMAATGSDFGDATSPQLSPLHGPSSGDMIESPELQSANANPPSQHGQHQQHQNQLSEKEDGVASSVFSSGARATANDDATVDAECNDAAVNAALSAMRGAVVRDGHGVAIFDADGEESDDVALGTIDEVSGEWCDDDPPMFDASPGASPRTGSLSPPTEQQRQEVVRMLEKRMTAAAQRGAEAERDRHEVNARALQTRLAAELRKLEAAEANAKNLRREMAEMEAKLSDERRARAEDKARFDREVRRLELRQKVLEAAAEATAVPTTNSPPHPTSAGAASASAFADVRASGSGLEAVDRSSASLVDHHGHRGVGPAEPALYKTLPTRLSARKAAVAAMRDAHAATAPAASFPTGVSVSDRDGQNTSVPPSGNTQEGDAHDDNGALPPPAGVRDRSHTGPHPLHVHRIEGLVPPSQSFSKLVSAEFHRRVAIEAFAADSLAAAICRFALLDAADLQQTFFGEANNAGGCGQSARHEGGVDNTTCIFDEEASARGPGSTHLPGDVSKRLAEIEAAFDHSLQQLETALWEKYALALKAAQDQIASTSAGIGGDSAAHGGVGTRAKSAGTTTVSRAHSIFGLQNDTELQTQATAAGVAMTFTMDNLLGPTSGRRRTQHAIGSTLGSFVAFSPDRSVRGMSLPHSPPPAGAMSVGPGARRPSASQQNQYGGRTSDLSVGSGAGGEAAGGGAGGGRDQSLFSRGSLIKRSTPAFGQQPGAAPPPPNLGVERPEAHRRLLLTGRCPSLGGAVPPNVRADAIAKEAETWKLPQDFTDYAAFTAHTVFLLGAEGCGKTSVAHCLSNKKPAFFKAAPKVDGPTLVTRHTTVQLKDVRVPNAAVPLGGFDDQDIDVKAILRSSQRSSVPLQTASFLRVTEIPQHQLRAMAPGALPARGAVYGIVFDMTADAASNRRVIARQVRHVLSVCSASAFALPQAVLGDGTAADLTAGRGAMAELRQIFFVLIGTNTDRLPKSASDEIVVQSSLREIRDWAQHLFDRLAEGAEAARFGGTKSSAGSSGGRECADKTDPRSAKSVDVRSQGSATASAPQMSYERSSDIGSDVSGGRPRRGSQHLGSDNPTPGNGNLQGSQERQGPHKGQQQQVQLPVLRARLIDCYATSCKEWTVLGERPGCAATFQELALEMYKNALVHSPTSPVHLASTTLRLFSASVLALRRGAIATAMRDANIRAKSSRKIQPRQSECLAGAWDPNEGATGMDSGMPSPAASRREVCPSPKPRLSIASDGGQGHTPQRPEPHDGGLAHDGVGHSNFPRGGPGLPLSPRIGTGAGAPMTPRGRHSETPPLLGLAPPSAASSGPYTTGSQHDGGFSAPLSPSIGSSAAPPLPSSTSASSVPVEETNRRGEELAQRFAMELARLITGPLGTQSYAATALDPNAPMGNSGTSGNSGNSGNTGTTMLPPLCNDGAAALTIEQAYPALVATYLAEKKRPPHPAPAPERSVDPETGVENSAPLSEAFAAANRMLLSAISFGITTVFTALHRWGKYAGAVIDSGIFEQLLKRHMHLRPLLKHVGLVAAAATLNEPYSPAAPSPLSKRLVEGATECLESLFVSAVLAVARARGYLHHSPTAPPLFAAIYIGPALPSQLMNVVSLPAGIAGKTNAFSTGAMRDVEEAVIAAWQRAAKTTPGLGAGSTESLPIVHDDISKAIARVVNDAEAGSGAAAVRLQLELYHSGALRPALFSFLAPAPFDSIAQNGVLGAAAGPWAHLRLAIPWETPLGAKPLRVVVPSGAAALVGGNDNGMIAPCLARHVDRRVGQFAAFVLALTAESEQQFLSGVVTVHCAPLSLFHHAALELLQHWGPGVVTDALVWNDAMLVTLGSRIHVLLLSEDKAEGKATSIRMCVAVVEPTRALTTSQYATAGGGVGASLSGVFDSPNGLGSPGHPQSGSSATVGSPDAASSSAALKEAESISSARSPVANQVARTLHQQQHLNLSCVLPSRIDSDGGSTDSDDDENGDGENGAGASGNGGERPWPKVRGPATATVDEVKQTIVHGIESATRLFDSSSPTVGGSAEFTLRTSVCSVSSSSAKGGIPQQPWERSATTGREVLIGVARAEVERALSGLRAVAERSTTELQVVPIVAGVMASISATSGPAASAT